MTDEAKIGAGDVEITIEGKSRVLRPSLKACQRISRQSGGILDAIRRVGQYDFDEMVYVIGAGLDTDPDDMDALAESVWRSGLKEIAMPTIKFLTIIANGGRPADGDKEKDPPKASV